MPQLGRCLRHAEIGQAGHTGQRCDRIGAGREHALGRTLLHIGQDRADRTAEKVDVPPEVVLDSFAGAAERDGSNLDPLANEDALGRQLDGAADPVSAICVLAGGLLQDFKEFSRVVRREVFLDADDGRGDVRHADGEVIPGRVGCLLHVRRHRQRSVPEATERISVRTGLCHRSRAEHAAATRPVHDHHLLSENGFDQVGELADDEVGAASGRRGNDHLDRARGVLILRHRRCGKNEAGAKQGRAPGAPMTVDRSDVFHLVSPGGRLASSARGRIFG